MGESSAIYEPMIPMGWIGSEPKVRPHELSAGADAPAEWSEEVLSKKLACGISITAQRSGFTTYNFADWAPGIPARTKAFQSFDESSEQAKPALIQRLRVINVHLTLLHAAAMVLDGESPTVVRVGEVDLLGEDMTDEGQWYWYRAGGAPLHLHSPPTDRTRFGIIRIPAFEKSIDWLDVVIQSDSLIEFDLVNQAQTALSTYDHATAVVTGWTVCELRTHALARGLPGIKAKTDSVIVTAALVSAGLLSAQDKARLDQVRRRRNKWLHQGQEPSEDDAAEALQLATELLQPIVPLQIRRTSTFVIL